MPRTELSQNISLLVVSVNRALISPTDKNDLKSIFIGLLSPISIVPKSITASVVWVAVSVSIDVYLLDFKRI